MADLVLPTKPQPPRILSPGVTVIYSKPKVGKSTIVSKLPKCLMLDFEKGTLALEAMSVQIEKFSDIRKIAMLIKEASYPYEFVAADTLSSLEEICMPEAERRYALSPEGKDWFLADPDNPKILHKKAGKRKYQNLLNIPYGKGYIYLQDVFAEVLDTFKKMAPKVILLAHSTVSTHVEDGQEITALDLMLQKKTKFTTGFKADSIGYMYRRGNQNFIDFSAAGDGGGRFRYLEKEPILISEYKQDEENGTEELITYWENVYGPEWNAKKEKSSATKKQTPKK